MTDGGKPVALIGNIWQSPCVDKIFSWDVGDGKTRGRNPSPVFQLSLPFGRWSPAVKRGQDPAIPITKTNACRNTVLTSWVQRPHARCIIRLPRLDSPLTSSIECLRSHF